MKRNQHHTSPPTGDQGDSPLEANAAGLGMERDELIRQIAYSHFEARNHTQGLALEDWLRAETKVKKMTAQSIKARETASSAS